MFKFVELGGSQLHAETLSTILSDEDIRIVDKYFGVKGPLGYEGVASRLGMSDLLNKHCFFTFYFQGLIYDIIYDLVNFGQAPLSITNHASTTVDGFLSFSRESAERYIKSRCNPACSYGQTIAKFGIFLHRYFVTTHKIFQDFDIKDIGDGLYAIE